MKKRRWNDYSTMIDEFECYLCEQLHEGLGELRVPHKDHYDCWATPVSVLSGSRNASNHWNEIIRTGICEGKMIATFVRNNVSYTEAMLYEEADRLMLRDEC